jgi:regulator of sirC expression with transglutaminase-like and TPR domain
MKSDTRARFAALAAGPDEGIDLDEGALLIAAEHYPALEVAAVRRQLDSIAGTVSARAPRATHRERLAALIDTLVREMCFRGNSDDYYDPRNSFLNDVIDRRVGIPISLSILYLEVARRIDLPLVGLNFPGHFLVRYPGPEPPAVLDVFAGAREIPDPVLQDRIRAASPSPLSPAQASGVLERLFAGAPKKEILARMLTNLKMIFLQTEDLPQALAAVERILLLRPNAATEIRDRAVIYHRLECFGPALADYKRYLPLAPDDSEAVAIRAAIMDLERQVAHLS